MQIVVTSNLNPSTARNTITNLRRKGKIALVRIEGRRRLYALADSPTAEAEAPENPEYGEPIVTF